MHDSFCSCLYLPVLEFIFAIGINFFERGCCHAMCARFSQAQHPIPISVCCQELGQPCGSFCSCVPLLYLPVLEFILRQLTVAIGINFIGTTSHPSAHWIYGRNSRDIIATRIHIKSSHRQRRSRRTPFKTRGRELLKLFSHSRRIMSKFIYARLHHA